MKKLSQVQSEGRDFCWIEKPGLVNSWIADMGGN